MNTNQQNNPTEEIDLGVLIKKINGFFGNLSFSIFKGIEFIKKNSLIFLTLFVLGAGLGYFFDNNNVSYKSEVIVTPNMGGTDYLYSKIDLISSKLKERDNSFFKSIGINNPQKIASIEIEPVIDIYNFVNNSTSAASAQNTQNFELVKLLSESSDINKVINDKLTSKNYPHHKIMILTSDKTTLEATIKPLMKFLNTDEYLNKILEVSKENILIKMKKNEQLIAQTDSLIRILTVNLLKDQSKASLVYNNANNQFNDFFNLKNGLINEIGSQKIALINSNSVIKDISTVVNIRDDNGINGKLKLIFPILFVFIYILIKLFSSFYQSQKAKLK